MLYLVAFVMTVVIAQEIYSSSDGSASSTSSSTSEDIAYVDQMNKLGSTKVLNGTKKSVAIALLLGQYTTDTTLSFEDLEPGKEQSLSSFRCLNGKTKRCGGDHKLRLIIGSPFGLSLGIPKNTQRIKLLAGIEILFDDANDAIKDKDNKAAGKD